MNNPPVPTISREYASEAMTRIEAAVGDIIRGKSEQIRLAVACMVAEGHLLIEDRPGTGKTSLAKAIAGAIGGSVRRIQFTPDLMASDVTGVSVFDRDRVGFSFRQGPVFANIVIADEINRASPKTQSALLEVMEERQVTNDGYTHPLPHPFMVVATQNPFDFHGTYPLPETQLDRFAMKLSLGYASRDAELDVMARPDGHLLIDELEPVLPLGAFTHLITAARAVAVSESMRHYVADVVEATRQHADLRLGVSTRGTLILLALARSLALSNGRGFVAPDDIAMLVQPVLAHRVAVTIDAEMEGTTAAQVLARIVEQVPVPRSRTVAQRSA